MTLSLVTVPEGASNGVRVARFEVTASDVRLGMLSNHGGRGYTKPGTYTKLMRGGYLWMSDTYDEQRDHWPIVHQLHRCAPDTRVLITGLGLGMIVQEVLHTENVTHVDVVEIDPDVLSLVAPHYENMAANQGKAIRFIEGDACQRKTMFTSGDRWNLAWHDIWPDLCIDNLAEMATIARSYCRFVDWQGFWGKDLLLYERDRQRRAERRWML